MKTYVEEPTSHNFKTLDVLQDLFNKLNELNAIIGRDEERIVIDTNKASFICEKVTEIYHKSILSSKNGSMRIFSDFVNDSEINILFLNINPSIIFSDNVFSKFPAYNEVQSLIKNIPILTKNQSEDFKLIHDRSMNELFKVMKDSKEEIFEALFSGNNRSENLKKYH